MSNLRGRVEKLERRGLSADDTDFSRLTDEELARALAEAEPHAYGLTPEQVLAMSDADLLRLVDGKFLNPDQTL